MVLDVVSFRDEERRKQEQTSEWDWWSDTHDLKEAAGCFSTSDKEQD